MSESHSSLIFLSLPIKDSNQSTWSTGKKLNAEVVVVVVLVF